MTVLSKHGMSVRSCWWGTEHDEGEVPERARRRTFTAAYKLRILAEYEAADPGRRGGAAPGGPVSSLLVEWRRSRDAGALTGLSATRERPPADRSNGITPGCARATPSSGRTWPLPVR